MLASLLLLTSQSVVLRLSPVVGERMTTLTEITIAQGMKPAEVAARIEVVERVVAIGEKILVNRYVASASGEGGPQWDLDLPRALGNLRGKTFRFELDRRNQVLKGGGAALPSTGLTLPEGPVAIGSTWSVSLADNTFTGVIASVRDIRPLGDDRALIVDFAAPKRPATNIRLLESGYAVLSARDGHTLLISFGFELGLKEILKIDVRSRRTEVPGLAALDAELRGGGRPDAPRETKASARR